MSSQAVVVPEQEAVRQAESENRVTSDIGRIDAVFARQWENRHRIAKTTAAERRAKIRRILDWTMDHREEICKAGFDDFRKPAAEVDLSEIFAVTSEAKHAMRHVKKWMKPKKVMPSMAMATTRSFVQYEAKGVVLIISPWNYGFNLCVGPLISAIAAGNCVCIKPSEMTPAMSGLVRGMVGELFDEDEVAVFEGEVDVASALLEKPFHHIFFTGSPQVGKVIMKAATKHLSGVTLELGGKSPTIVDETANLKDTVEKICWGKFLNNGQTCIAPDYLLVHDKIYEPLLEQLCQRINKVYGSDSEQRRQSPDYARIVNRRHFARLKKILDGSVEMGAKVVQGGACVEAECFIEPTLLTDVPMDAPAMQEEIFGPLLPILRYSNLKEAIDLINKGEKPLALYLFSSSSQNKKMVLASTSSGGACINEVNLQFAHTNLPFGGINNSGLGNAHGHYGFKAFSHERAVLQHHRFSLLKLLYPPYGKLAKKMADITLKYF